LNASTPQVLKEVDAVEDAEGHDFSSVPGRGANRLVVRQEANRDCIVFIVQGLRDAETDVVSRSEG